MRKNKKGMTLILLITLILFASIVMLSFIQYLGNAIRLKSAVKSANPVAQDRAYFAALAAINAIDPYQFDSMISYPNGPWPTVLGDGYVGYYQYFLILPYANFVVIGAADSVISGSAITNVSLKKLDIQDVWQTPAYNPKITSMKVEWGGSSSGLKNRLMSVTLGGAARWSGSAVSGEKIALNPPLEFGMDRVTEPSLYYYPGLSNSWVFANGVPGSSSHADGGPVIATFYFQDGSSRTAFISAGDGGNSVSITSTGGGTSKFIYMNQIPETESERTLEAIYDMSFYKATSISERFGANIKWRR